jgi:predicted DCC family thiol-disulfide oxidoreductase YuxK
MNSIILFDGVCNFCNGAVNFVIRNDRKGRFKFAPLQSETGNQLRAEHNIGDDVDSIVLIEDGEAYTLSTAALRIARGLDGIWKLAYALIIIPKSIRDRVYRVIANNRYRWFGKKDACMVPTPDLRERFLSEPPA